MSEREIQDGPPDPGRTAAVGAPVKRVDAPDKVTGRAVYLDDMVVPGVLHAALVFPGCAHAVLRGVDASAARSMAGVRSTLTADDIPGENQVGVIDADQPLLPFDRIRYEGDAVAIVVAETSALARDAADAVSVDLT
ncbi:MAG: xanthine dehydrogenase family protein molybdopterin-binding subunit, partial [Candidatus Eisenbacteria sp.]|nr:xanthine dehydrogenase family protein molybdopterin-binding subunit [Candidatus Eisenbacteria bacterium]